MARDITDETNESIVVNPKKTHAFSPKIHLCSIMVTTVIGMLSTETSRSANARLRRNPFEMVRRFFLLVKIENRAVLPRIDAVQMRIRINASIITEVVVETILRFSFLRQDHIERLTHLKLRSLLL